MAADEFSEYPDTGAEGAGEHSHPQDDSIWFTNKNNYNEYEPPRPDADYGVGASGSVSVAARQGSGGGSAAPFIHPFKLEKVTDPEDPNSTKVRVYAGDVFAKIDTFQLGIVTVTTGASHTHSAGSYRLPEHQHEGYNDSSSTGLTIPTHTHTQGGTAAAAGSPTKADTDDESSHTHGLSLATPGGSDGIHSHSDEGTHSGHAGSSDGMHSHTNSGGHSHDLSNNTATGAPSSGHHHEYETNNHSHTLSGQTGGVHDHSTAANKKVAGNTADVVPQSGSLPLNTGTSGTSSSSTTVHKFVVITGQSKAPNPTATNWTATFNKAVKADDGSDTLFKYHESANSNGEFYVKWVITINETALVQTVVGSIERVAVGAAPPDDDPFEALHDNGNGTLHREDADARIGTFYQKIGKVDTNTIEQDQFSNINWGMTVLPEVS